MNIAPSLRRPPLTEQTLKSIKRKAVLGKSADEILLSEFGGYECLISRKYLGRLVSAFNRGASAERGRIISRFGPPKKLKLPARRYLLEMMKSQNSQIAITETCNRFLDRYYERRKGIGIPGYCTVYRAVKKAQYTRCLCDSFNNT